MTPSVQFCVMTSKMRSTMLGAGPREGFSARTSRGRDVRAREVACIFCSPPERVPAARARRSARMGKRRQILPRSAAVRAGAAHSEIVTSALAKPETFS